MPARLARSKDRLQPVQLLHGDPNNPHPSPQWLCDCAPEPKKPEENPASKFSSASKYAALSVDGEDENEGEDYAE